MGEFGLLLLKLALIALPQQLIATVNVLFGGCATFDQCRMASSSGSGCSTASSLSSGKASASSGGCSCSLRNLAKASFSASCSLRHSFRLTGPFSSAGGVSVSGASAQTGSGLGLSFLWLCLALDEIARGLLKSGAVGGVSGGCLFGIAHKSI